MNNNDLVTDFGIDLDDLHLEGLGIEEIDADLAFATWGSIGTFTSASTFGSCAATASTSSTASSAS